VNKTTAINGYAGDLQAGKIQRGNLQINKDFLTPRLAEFRKLKVLEIGCGAGQLTHWLSENGIDVMGVDMSPNLIEYAMRGRSSAQFAVMDAQSLAFASQSFDVVLSFDVLEHLPDVSSHLHEVRRVLREGGSYLLQTPNKYTNMPYEIWKSKSLTRYRTYHCSLQTARSLKSLFCRNGFQISFFKMDVRTEFFREKLRKAFGLLGRLLMTVPYHKLPLLMVTNLYVIAQLPRACNTDRSAKVTRRHTTP
jgi:2-polyprenyl-3-methyl-5-hydroxy-6-metoxy-1,4-benzoquinol methylase